MEQLRYGYVKGGKVSTPWAWTDAETVKGQSGRFVFRNITTGLIEIANTTDDIVGFAEEGDLTTSDSESNVIIDLTAVFSIPLAYDASTYTVNYSQTIQGECCDLVVVSDVQYANPTVATNKTLLIVGGVAATGTTVGVNDGYLLVMINPSALGNLGVGA